MLDIEKNFSFRKNDIIVIACSAGPDSMALFHMLLSIREKYNLKLICAHVNHNVRKKSLEEAKFVEKYCKLHNVLFETMTITEYGDDNFENEARNIRYNFFDKLMEKYKADYLMTAHHGDDLIETILMRISRGSNLNGYSGFHKIVDKGNYKIVRPLISFTKEQLEEYDKTHDVNYYIDASNKKMTITRNRYRRHMLPFLRQETKNIHLKYLKFSNNLQEAYQYIKKERDRLYNIVVDKESSKIDIDKFKEIDVFMQKEILYYLLEEYYQDDLILLNDRHIELMRGLINSSKSNSKVILPNEVRAVKNYNLFYLEKVTGEITEYEIEFNEYVKLPNGHEITLISETVDNSNNICRLNSNDINLPLIVRTRKDGDRMMVKGLNGSKKVKDMFIEAKIKPRERDFWPVVVDSYGNIVWLPGLKKSKFDRKKSESYDIILKYH